MVPPQYGLDGIRLKVDSPTFSVKESSQSNNYGNPTRSIPEYWGFEFHFIHALHALVHYLQPICTMYYARKGNAQTPLLFLRNYLL